MRALRIVGAVLLGLVGLVVLVVGGSWAMLHTDWGGERIRRVMVTQVDRRIAGKLDVGRLTLDGWTVTLERVRLIEPDGDDVARIERVRVGIAVLPLVRRKLVIREVQLDAPWVQVVQDADGGSNLARAVAPADGSPKPPATPDRDAKAGPQLSVELERLGMRDGEVDFRGAPTDSGPGPRWHAKSLALDARGSAQLADQRFQANAQLTGALLEPLAHPLSLTVATQGVGPAVGGNVRLTVGPALVVADGNRDAVGAIAAHLRQFRITPEVACVGRTPCPLVATVTGTADLALDGRQKGTASFRLDAGEGGDVVGRAQFDLERRTVATLDVRGHAINGAALATAAPPSRFDVVLIGADLALGPQDWRGRATLTIPPGLVAGRRFGPVDVRVHATSRDDATGSAAASLPGARLDAKGRIAAGVLDADGKLVLSSLETLMKAVAPASARGPSAPRGQATITFRATGRTDKFDASVDAVVPRLQAGSTRVTGARITARLPAAPGVRVGQLRADVRELDAGTTQFGRVGVTAQAKPEGTQGTHLSLKASISKPEQVTLATTGALVDPQHARIDQLTVAYPEATWTSTGRPARLTFGPGELRVAGFALASGDQSLAVDVWQKGVRREAVIRIEALDLARLPRLAQPKDRPLAGRVDVAVDLGGTERRPRLDVKAHAEKLALGPRRLGDVTAKVNAPDGKPITATLDWSYGPRPLNAEIQAPFTLADLMNGSPQLVVERAIRDRRPFSLRANLERFPLALVDELAGKTGQDKTGLRGEVSFQADLGGPLLSPLGTLNIRALEVAKGKDVPPTSGELTLEAKRGSLTAQLAARRRDVELVRANLDVGLPSRPPRDLDDAFGLPIKLDARLGPLRVQRLGLVPSNRRTPPRTLHGMLQAKLTATGTIGDPHIDLTARTEGLALDQEALGTVRLHAVWKGREAKVDLDAASSQNGTFALTARADAGAKLAQLIKRPPDPTRLPFQVKLAAKSFDLAWASGLVRSIPTTAGTLNANLEANGPLQAVRARGDLHIEKGAATVVGYGRFEDIRVSMSGDERSVKLDEVYLKSGNGHARLTGKLDRPVRGDARVSANLETKDFLVKTEGQDLGSLSLRARADGVYSGTALTIQPLTIDETHFTVASGRRKNLQDLKEPKDVVLFKDGKPLNAHQGRKLAALQARDEAAAANLALGGDKPVAPLAVRVYIKAPRNLWVHAEDATVEIGLSDDFRVYQEPTTRVFGQVLIRRSHVKLLGRRFTVDQGSSVTFGGAPMVPRFDLTARHKSETADVTVIAKLTGTPETPKLTLTSDPPYPETAIVSLLVTGRLDLDQRSGAAASGGGKAASLLGGFLAARLQKTLGKRLPLDVLTIEPGQGPGSAYLEAGTYLTDELYVAYVGRLGADPTRYQNRNLVHLEYQLTHRWSFEGEYGDARTGSADLTWKKRY